MLFVVLVALLLVPGGKPATAQQCLEACCTAFPGGNYFCPESTCGPVYDHWAHCLCEEVESIAPPPCYFRTYCVLSGNWCYGIVIWG